MTTEQYAYWNDNKNHPCIMHNFIIDHPEIKAVRLKWSWIDRCIFDVFGLKFKACGSLDIEYTFVGLRKDALTFLKEYDCWDWVPEEPQEYKINDYGILDVQHVGEDPQYFDFNHYCDGQPDAFEDWVLVDNSNEDLLGLVWEWCKANNEEYRIDYHIKRAGL